MKKDQAQYDSAIYLIGRLFKEYLKPHIRSLLIAILCMFVAAIATAINAWLMQPALDDIFLKRNHTMLYIAPIGIILNSVIKGIATFVQSSIMKMVGQRMVSEIQLTLYSHIIHSDMRVLLDYPSGSLISRFTNDINAMRKGMSDAFTGLIMELCTLLGLISIMFYQSIELATLAIFIIPLTFYPMMQLGRKMRKIARGIQEGLGDFTVRLDETFQNVRIIKSYCRENYEIARTRSLVNRAMDLYKKAVHVEAASSPIMECFGGIIVALIIWYSGAQVISGNTTPGAFFSFIVALLMAYKPLRTISALNTSIQEALAAYKRMFSFLDQEIKITDRADALNVTFASCDIELRNVYFSYTPENKILDNLSMHIPHGNTVALVGTSGSGKTTILNLIERLYDPNFGSILIGGYDIKNVRLRSLRSSISLVSQEVALFDDTILENIRYGMLEASDSDIVQAAIDAAAHDFIVSLPDGYNTDIGQHGAKISGGQRQRIAIARAILKNAPILLLDEATSALDSISEKQVQSALDYLKKGRTTIVIAHRLSTIESADLIYVISDGCVVEHGHHAELIAKCGEYAQLYDQYYSSGKNYNE